MDDLRDDPDSDTWGAADTVFVVLLIAPLLPLVVLRVIQGLERISEGRCWMDCRDYERDSRRLSGLCWFCFWFNLLFTLGWVGAQCWNYPEWMNSLYAAVGYTGGCYLFMLVEAVFCKELQLLRILQSKTKTVKEIIEALRRERPSFRFVVACSRELPVARTVYWNSSEGTGTERRNQQETQPKKVITCAEIKEFFFEHWLDDSEEFAGGKLLATRLTLDLRVEPGDEETREEMERMKTELHNRNRFPDAITSVEEHIEVLGFEEDVFAFVDRPGRCIGTRFFWIATALGLTWPYRWYFLCKAGDTSFAISKKMFLSRPPETPLGSGASPRASRASLIGYGATANERAPSGGQSETEPLLGATHVQIQNKT